MLLAAQNRRGIDFCRAIRGPQRREKRDDKESKQYRAVDRKIIGRNVVKEWSEEACDEQRTAHPQDCSDHGEPKTLSHDLAHDMPAGCTQGDAYPDFVRPLRHRVAQHPITSDRREGESDQR